MFDRTGSAVAGLLLALSGLPATAAAGWVPDGIPLSSTDSTPTAIVADGSGGAIVLWLDSRSGVAADIYGQHVDANGGILWTPGGLSVCSAAQEQQNPVAVSDGLGGVLVAWTDLRAVPSSIYAQRASGMGWQWVPDGVLVETGPFSTSTAAVTSDGAGGAILAWGVGDDIYAQRLGAGGTVLWGAGGVPVCRASGYQADVEVVGDDAGGAILAWWDQRAVTTSEIYAQRLDADGNALWTLDGILVSTRSAHEGAPRLVTDGAGGAIVFWNDAFTADRNIWAQRIDPGGNVLWTSDGKPVCQAPGNLGTPRPASFGAGGAVAVWTDPRNGNEDLYAQRLDAAGDPQWAVGGVPVCTETHAQITPVITSDGATHVIICWEDQRSGRDIYAQQLDPGGTIRWAVDGVAVCTATGDQQTPRVTEDGTGGAIVAWADWRSGAGRVYAQRLFPSPTITSIADVPNDQGGWVDLQWEASPFENPPGAVITHYSLWRRMPLAAGAAVGANDAEAPGRRSLSGPPAQRRVQGYAWEWLRDVPVHGFPTYAQTVPTQYDSTDADPGWHFYMVSAQTSDPGTFFDSPVDSGYSVDNLAPGVPTGLAYAAGLLTWDPAPEPDFDYFTVYGSDTNDFGTAARIGYTVTPSFDVQSSPFGWYFVTATDFGGNESGDAGLRNPTFAGGLAAPPSVLHLGWPRPNPSAGTTAIPFELPRRLPTTVAIYDVAGRVVRMLLEEESGPGRYVRTWDGNRADGTATSPGVYFVRITAGKEAAARRLVRIR